jgi:activator of 2-hydroxyglutaryl-CoA dehydratase
MGTQALSATASEEVASMCAVFAESEIISHVHRGVNKDQILAGLHDAVADRIVEIVSRVRVEPEVVISGGVALNPAIIKCLEDRLKLKPVVPSEPQLFGALGAALIASEKSGG